MGNIPLGTGEDDFLVLLEGHLIFLASWSHVQDIKPPTESLEIRTYLVF